MKNVFTAGAKSLVLAFAFVLFLTLTQSVARAETLLIHGLTVGSFNGSIFMSPSNTLLGLTFNGTSFPNPIAIADTSVPSFTLTNPTEMNLGTFTLTNDPATYTGNTFALQLTFSFSTPGFPTELTIVGGSQPSFTANLVGTIQSSPDGFITIDFNNAPSVFTVTLDGNVISTFSLVISDVIIAPGETRSILSTVSQTSTIPEPATLLMLGGGLAAVGTAVRKRRRPSP